MYDVQTLQILAVLATKAPVCLPNPIPPWCVFASGSKENDGVVGLDIQVEISQDPSAGIIFQVRGVLE
jgi:hypothetical protein